MIANILIGFGALQALFISSIFLFQVNGARVKRILAILLSIEGITLFERLLAETGLIEALPHFIGISYPLSFLKAPAIFFAGMLITNGDFKFKRTHLFHLLPFVLMLGLNIPMYFQSGTYKLQMVKEFIASVPGYDDFNFYLFLLFYGHIGSYVVVSLLRINNYTRHVKNNKPANWYKKVLWLYSLFLSISLVYFVLLPSGQLEIPMFNIVTMLIMSFVIQSMAYSFFLGADIFTQSTPPMLANLNQRLEDEKLIINKLETDKDFLNSNLTLDDFSIAIGLPKKYVSELINQKFNSSFKDFINSYRVKEAKTLMQQSIKNKTHLIDIALESGFNNKVSFYRSFKKHTNKSPSDFYADLRKEP
ncbi:hypothetical protein BFP97_05405 [Roseivirga sp. 4D4]|uniref:helix-turn-helix domain-containing protein n=1 Tax=Roseivirga sp. 4D4 TaxID=1889784 RepID=UPI000852C447|nr:helix-turn-helix domain-containing protein [Roseivirga sp. 4D4]OEK00980.1 hypothetical protein BFP97_05405 [Roseivirga sp. 4D4]